MSIRFCLSYRYIVNVLLCIVMILSPIYRGYGDTLSSLRRKQQQLQEIRRKLRQARVRLKYQKLRESDLYRQLNNAWHKVAVVEREIKNMEREKEIVERGIRKVEKRLAKTERELEELETAFRFQLLFLTRYYSTWIYEGILGESDMDTVLDRIYLLKIVLVREADLMERIRLKQEKVFQLKASLEDKKKRLERYLKLLAEKHKRYSSLVRKRQELLKKLRKEREKTEEELENYEQISKKIQRELQQLIIKAQREHKLRYTGGVFLWPTNSTYITSPFGYRWHPILGGYRFHSGIDIAGDYGDPIYAAASGVVIMARYYDGYGYTVIIDHGSGISTLYAHCSRILVRVGQSVLAGQEIAEIGSTGRSTGPHLHFEVRIDGKPVNPLHFLSR